MILYATVSETLIASNIETKIRDIYHVYFNKLFESGTIFENIAYEFECEVKSKLNIYIGTTVFNKI